MCAPAIGCAEQLVGWPAPDIDAPTVTSTTPARGAQDVAFNTPVSATFSEPMDAATVSSSTFTVLDGTTVVPGTVVYVGLTALFTPAASFQPGVQYEATIASSVRDVYPMHEPHMDTHISGLQAVLPQWA